VDYDSSVDGAAVKSAEFAEFLSRLVNGDAAAWNRFVAEFHPLIASVAARASLEHADDIEQEIYFAVVNCHFNLLRRFDGASRPAFLVYLKHIAENIARNFARKQFRRQADLCEVLEHLADERDTPETLLIKQVDLSRLDEAINELRPDYQNVLKLIIKGYRHREVAELLSIPLKTSLTWANRAVQELRKKFNLEIKSGGENILS